MVQEVLQRKQEPWRWGAQWLAIKSWQWSIESHHRSWSSNKYMRSCQRTQHWPFYSHLAFEVNWKGENFQFWVTRNFKKKIVLKSHLLSMQQQWTISPPGCDMWWKVDIIQQLTTASSVRRNSKESQTCSKLAPKKAHDHCLVVCCPSDPLQLSEVQQNHYSEMYA